MSDGAPELAGGDAPPDVDPEAVHRSYRTHRARRHARVAHRRRTRRAGARFWVVLILLLVACAALALTTWQQIGDVFGL